MVCYKESQEIEKIDPHPTMWTGRSRFSLFIVCALSKVYCLKYSGTFRDSRAINPEGADPENSLTGQIFTVNAWRNDALVIPRSFSRLRIWRNAKLLESLRLKPPFLDRSSYTYMLPNYRTQRKGSLAEPWVTLKQGILGHEWDEDLV